MSTTNVHCVRGINLDNDPCHNSPFNGSPHLPPERPQARTLRVSHTTPPDLTLRMYVTWEDENQCFGPMSILKAI
jgi:hypothetical protein